MRADSLIEMHQDANQRACMLGFHSSSRLKYIAEVNYIFIMANGPWCPITVQECIFNNPAYLSDCLREPVKLALQGEMSILRV